jgi:hypothetical protein
MCELEEQVFIQRCLDSQKDGLTGTAKELTETAAKGFYDKLWGLICEWNIAFFSKARCLSNCDVVAAKQSTRHEIKLKNNHPSMWSNFQVRDYVEEQLPAIDVDKFCPTLVAKPRRGRDFVWDMGEHPASTCLHGFVRLTIQRRGGVYYACHLFC